VTNLELTFNQACDALGDILSNSNLSFGHGAPDADSEALWILAHCIDIPPLAALDVLADPYPKVAYEKAISIANLRIESRKPLAYILGEAWLMGYDFICDERSIVPRSFIAELIFDDSLELYLPPHGKALDLCTGNGSLAILLSLQYPDIQVCATDISSSALDLAELNVNKYQLNQKLNLFCGDLFDALLEQSSHYKFDIILCNPPYVNSHSMSQLPQEYLHEPQIALAGGDDGMSIIDKIIHQAKNYLNKDGVIVIEIGNEYQNFQKTYPILKVDWLEVSGGNEQVCLIHYEDLP
jgi:ribosomal protein L3 glutamine methyltransferase